MRTKIDELRKRDKRIIVGVEGGSSPEALNAAIVEVGGCGDDTLLLLHGFCSRTLPEELGRVIRTIDEAKSMSVEDATSVNFLLLHNVTLLFRELIEKVDRLREKAIDLVGLKDLELGGRIFPLDPSALSEMLGCIVACRFCIGVGEGEKERLPIRDSIFKSMLDDMIDRFGLEDNVREAAAVALLANEALFHEGARELVREVDGSLTKKSLRTKKKAAGYEREAPYLYGEFFFPE